MGRVGVVGMVRGWRVKAELRVRVTMAFSFSFRPTHYVAVAIWRMRPKIFFRGHIASAKFGPQIFGF